jgi:zinc transport system substrate-binding protein
MKLAVSAALCAALWTTAALADAPKVVATIKPIHALVAAVMGDLGSPALIVKSGASPHTYSLRPSDAAALESADIVFWTGHGMELFLEDALESLASGANVVELAGVPGIELLPIREGGAFESHEYEDEHAEDHGHDDHERDHDHGEMDMHYWLDPANAAQMVAAIADALAAADPEHATVYEANAEAATEQLTALAGEIDTLLAPVRAKPFIVFHDAYQYFERRFGLTVAGSITVTPDTLPGAQRIGELRARISTADAVCVFAEPQFEPAVVATIIEGTSARSGTLDPEGAGLSEGPGLYRELLLGLSDGLLDCLATD